MKVFLFLFLSILLFGCKYDNSKWETLKDNSKVNGTVENAIYFQDTLRGLIGGFKLVENINSKNLDNLDCIPIIYFTKDGGINWKSIDIKEVKEGTIDNLRLSGDTIICQIDSLVLKSNNLGKNWNLIEKSNYIKLNEKYFPNANQYKKLYNDFEFESKKYTIKESYKNKNIDLIICYGEETMTDYYFYSRDKGKNWIYLQNETGSNRYKFLLNDEYIISYHYYFGLQKIKLK
ncbi:hypothetical protein [Flavobacterium sp. I-STPA6A]|uniref:hypothetical protein n=1 Tax=Flavobacterium sp. I-STPA6A TaxID=2590450 RepID=UPI00131C22C8|nr:hypothetical protein [Flavobacterium sp. I-STPA6A]